MDTVTLSIMMLVGMISFIFYKASKPNYKSFLIAFIMSFLWVMFYGYDYIGVNFYLFGIINVFPLVAWTGGLVILYELFLFMEKRLNNKWKVIAATYLAYLVLLVPIEAIGYNILNIQLNSSYPGLFGLPLIHGPPVLKAYYLTAGGIFLLIMAIIENKKH